MSDKQHSIPFLPGGPRPSCSLTASNNNLTTSPGFLLQPPANHLALWFSSGAFYKHRPEDHGEQVSHKLGGGGRRSDIRADGPTSKANSVPLPGTLFVCSPASYWALTEANIDQGLVKALPLCSTTSPWTSVQNAAAQGQSHTTHFSLFLGGAPGCNHLSSTSFGDNAIKM